MSGPSKWIHLAQKHSAIHAAQSIICISESTKNDLLKYIKVRADQNIYVTHLAASETFQPLNVQINHKPFVLFVGNRDGYKNFKFLLSAMCFLPDFDLLCVGGESIRSDELNGVSQFIASRVHHKGYVSDIELNELYNSAVCLVYPSTYEGFGIPVVEAMKAGCPVVCVDCKAVVEVGRDALSIVNGDDPREMANAILNTMSSSRSNLIKRGFQVAQGYSWNNTHRQTLEVYRSLGA